MVKEYKRRREFVVKRLNEIEVMSCKLPKGAFYVFPSIKELNMSSLDCTYYLLDHAKVSVVPGTGEGYVRISYATSLEEALRRRA